MKLKITHLFSKPNFLWFLLFFTSLGWGQTTVTKVFSNLGNSNITLPTGEIDANITFSTQKNSAQNPPIFHESSDAIRIYPHATNGGSITFDFTNNITVTKVVIIGASNNTPAAKYFVDGGTTPTNITASSLVYTIENLNATNSFKFQMAATSGQMHLKSVSITYITTNEPEPILNVTPEQLTGLDYVQDNGPSAVQTIEISGNDLTGFLAIVSNNNNFQISDNGLDYHQSITFQNYTGVSKTMYIRLRDGLSTGNYNSTISISSNSITDPIIIPVTGTVSASNALPVITSTSFSGIVGTSFSEQIEATNNPTSYVVVLGSFPYDLFLNTQTGIISGTPLVAGAYYASIQANNENGNSALQTITFNIAKADQTVSLPNLIKTSLNSPIALPELTNEETELNYSSSNTNIATIEYIEGIPNIIYQGIGEATITATAFETSTHNNFSSTFTINFVEAPEITSITINDYVGNAINEQLIFTPTGSVTTLANGSTLPAGLTLNNSGLISGTPTEAGSFTTQVIASNSGLNSDPVSISFTLLNTSAAVDCLIETFSSITSGSNTTSNSSSIFNGNAFFPVANNSYQAGGAVRLGSGSGTGYIESNDLANISGTVIVTLDVKGWSSVEGNLRVTLGNQSQDISYTAIMTGSFETKTVVFENVPTNSKLRIATTSRRAFVDNVKICNNATNKNICVNSTIADLSATFEDSTNISWFASETSTAALAESFELINGIYYMQIGEQVTRIPFNVTLNQIPQAPVMMNEIFCGSTFVSNLPQGDAFRSYKWYANNEDGNALNSTESISTGTYYVSQTINGCESIERTAISVVINEIPAPPVVVAQTFCGTATVGELPQGSGSYKWYANLTDVNNLDSTTSLETGTYYVSTSLNDCESTRTAVSVVINEIPAAPTVAAQTFCGTARVNELPQGNGSYKWYANLTDAANLDLTSGLSTGTYYVSQTLNGCESIERTAVSVVINEIPATPIVAAHTFCGTTTVGELSQENGSHKWYANLNDAVNLDLATVLTTGTYYVSETLNGCESIERTAVSIVINEIPVEPVVAAQTFCGTARVDDLPQENGSYKWYANLTDAANLDSATSLETGTYYVSTTLNDCESARTAVSVVINEIPTAPVVAAQTFCGTTTVGGLPQGNGSYKWYANLADVASLDVTTVLTTGTYYVSTTLNDCESTRTAVSVVINEIPVAPIVSDQIFCGTTTIGMLPQGSGSYKWYSSVTSNSNLSLTTNLITGTYYVSEIVNGCESIERTAVSVVINEIPAAPTVAAQTFCGTARVNELPQGNGSYKWYANLTDAANLDLTSGLSTGTYYVSQTLNGCESIERTAVSVVINQIPAAPVVAAQTFCGTTTVGGLPQGNGSYKWYSNATSNSNLSLTTNLITGTYYVSEVLNSCEGIERTAVSVVINEIPAAPIVATQTFCGTTIVGTLPQGNGVYKWYSSATNNSNLSLTTNLITGTYYVSITSNGCESARTPVSVTIINVPYVSANSVQTFCGSATVSDLVATGMPGSEIQWFSSLVETTPLNTTTALTNGTYYVLQKVNDCKSARKPVIVLITPTTAPIVNPFIFCEGATVADLTIISQSGITHKWYFTAHSIMSLPLNAPLVTGTYYVSKVQNGCESLRSSVQVTILDLPATPTGSSEQSFIVGSTISDLTVQPDSAIWYITQDDAKTGTNPLADNMPLVQGTTYYAVVVGGNDCVSLPLAVTVTLTLSNADFVKNNLKYYPNPILDVLTIENTETVNQINIYNSLGQHLYSNKYKDSKVQIDFSSFSSGIYMIKVKTQQGEAYLKVIKK